MPDGPLRHAHPMNERRLISAKRQAMILLMRTPLWWCVAILCGCAFGCATQAPQLPVIRSATTPTEQSGIANHSPPGIRQASFRFDDHSMVRAGNPGPDNNPFTGAKELSAGLVV